MADRAPSAPDAMAILTAIPPHQASVDDIRRCERLVATSSPTENFHVWFESRHVLATFLLESAAIDHSSCVARAWALYRDLIQSIRPQTHTDYWATAVCGIANCIASAPEASPEAHLEASRLLDDLLAKLRDADDPDRLVVALSCRARLHENSRVGDADANLEAAIALTRQQIAVLGDAKLAPHRWARAHHNLAGLYSKRRIGLRSQNVDDSVAALREALVLEPA